MLKVGLYRMEGKSLNHRGHGGTLTVAYLNYFVHSTP
jgi:hypothetical protein